MPTLFASQHLSDSFVRLAITDTSFLKLVVGAVDPVLFPSKISEYTIRLCFEYYLQFKEAPGDHFHDEFVRDLDRHTQDERKSLITYIERINTMPPPNRDYILRRVGDFVKVRAREQAAVSFAEQLARGNVEEADLLMYDALKSGIESQEVGLRYLTDLSNLANRGDRPEYLVGTGVPAMDQMIGGLRRRQLSSWMGCYKGLKTWGLMSLANIGLMGGLRVCYISHEVTQEELELRFDMMHTARGTEMIGEQITYHAVNRDGSAIEPVTTWVRSVYDDKRAVERGRVAVRHFGGELIIRKYPMGQCTTHEIDRYLNYLETFENFVPDIVIIDYIDIMNLGDGETRDKLNRGYIWAKGLADERNIHVATASQANREAIRKARASMKDFAEDIRKAGNVDVAFAICRTELEVQHNLGHFLVIANRSGPMDVMCTFSPCPTIGQFCLSSWNSVMDKQLYPSLGILNPAEAKRVAETHK